MIKLIISLIMLTSCVQHERKMTKNRNEINAVQYRIARPTNQLERVVEFYKNALGLRELGSFKNHEGFDGVMLGLPDASHHLEFTQQVDGEEIPEPTTENLLVFYFDTPQKYAQAVNRMKNMSIPSVEPQNPYWAGKSHTYEDPDKWRIVFFNGVFEPDTAEE